MTARRGTESLADRRRRAIILSCPVCPRRNPAPILFRACRSTLPCSSPACVWPWGSLAARTRWRCCARWRHDARSWALRSMPRICTTACAAQRPMGISNSAANWRQSWRFRFTRRAWTRLKKREPMRKPENRPRPSKKPRGGCAIHGFNNSCPRVCSTQWRRHIRSTIRRKRFWPSSCVAHGPRVWQESVQDSRARKGGLCVRCWASRTPRLKRI